MPANPAARPYKWPEVMGKDTMKIAVDKEDLLTLIDEVDMAIDALPSEDGYTQALQATRNRVEGSIYTQNPRGPTIQNLFVGTRRVSATFDNGSRVTVTKRANNRLTESFYPPHTEDPAARTGGFYNDEDGFRADATRRIADILSILQSTDTHEYEDITYLLSDGSD